MEQIKDIILTEREEVIKISISSPFSKDEEFNKMTIRPVIIKKQNCFQAERFKNNQVFHLNMSESEFSAFLEEIFKKYAQIAVFKSGETITFSVGKNGKIKKSKSKNNLHQKSKNAENNRQKEYIFNEGENIPALVDLGVFTPDFKIVNSKYDKFKQINRFIEIVNDAFTNDTNENITILDFGCGKSYLTFIIYHYFAEVKKKNVKIIGYDLKKDVVENCNKIAEKYGYKNLKFIVSDVTKDVLYDEHIDMVISLHACDTATDFALNYAIRKNVKHIFSVPCCQHEVNKTIKKGGDFDILLKHGLIKERMSALLTDSIRAGILEDMGYSVDVLEFVDFSHSPKNIMLRAKKTKKPSDKNRKQIKELQEKYQFNQTLYKLVGDSNE
jgi:SAM-dependent methyltransferase